MKAMWAAMVAIVVIGLGAWAVLNSLEFTASEAQSSENVRLD